MSRMPATGYPRRRYTGRCAVRTMAPAPTMTIGRGCEGRGQAWIRSGPGVFMEMEDRLHRGPPFAGRGAWRRLLHRLHQRLPFGDARMRGDVRREGPADVETVRQIDQHHQPPPEHVDLQVGE